MEELIGEGTVVRRRRSHARAWLICIVIVIAAIGLPVAIAIIVTLIRAAPDPAKYAIVFDADSAGSRMHIYKWDGTKTHGWNGTPAVDEVGQCVTERSLSSFENDPAHAGTSLKSCLSEAKETISSTFHEGTFVYVVGSASLRMLKETNPGALNGILNSVRYTIKSSPFVFRSDRVRLVSELEEGVFRWMTANYLNVKLDYIKQLRSGESDLLGIVDSGDAAMLLSFVADPHELATLSNYTTMVQMFGHNYAVYSRSFHCYGKDEAYRRFLAHLYQSNPTQTTIPHPCAPRGTPLSLTYESLFESSCTDSEKPASHKSGNITFLGSGDPTACATLVATLFDRLFDGNRRPHLRGLFLALSAFFRTYEFYHFKDATSWTTLERLAESVDAFCTKTWDEVLTTPDAGQRTLQLSQLCFDGVYVTETLKALGFDSTTWTNVIATDTMKGTPVGLSLGFMLAEINTMPATVLSPDQNQGDYNYHYGVR